MKFASLTAALLALLLATPLAAQAPYGLEQGVLVLRSGQTLSGQIARQGEAYQVVIAPGSEVRIPLRDVRFFSTSLEEAYRLQRDGLAPRDIPGRLQLASWCIRMDLPHRAADQLLVVTQLDPHHEGLPAVERRLAAWEMVRRAARETEAQRTETKEQQATLSANSPYDVSALDQAIEQVPPELVESFAQRVQPLLVNRCGASGCHGYGSKTEYQVLRPSFQSSFTRRYTQRNLVSALQQIDRTKPERSPLLHKARALHGGEAQAVLLDRREQQNQLLADWIHALGESAAGPPAPAKPLPSAAASGESPVNDTSVEQASFSEPDDTEPAPAEPEAAAASSTNPLDPAVFNRRYHGRP